MDSFCIFHKIPYYNKASRSNVTLKNIFCPIIEKHHVDTINSEINTIGADAKLIVYGTYDAKTNTLTLGSDVYTFTPNHFSKKGNVSIDAVT